MLEKRAAMVGYTCIDYIKIGEKTTKKIGGSGYYASLGQKHLQRPSLLSTRIGNDFSSLSREMTHVDNSGVVIDSVEPTMSIYLNYPDPADMSRRSIRVDYGPAERMSQNDIPQAWLDSIAYYHIATMEPEKQLEFIKFLESMNKFISVDSELRYFKSENTRKNVVRNFQNADVVFVNRHEYDELRDVLVNHPRVILKLDRDGACLLENGIERLSVPAPRVDVIDSTGAGDVLAGVCISSLAQGFSIENSLERGVKIASQHVSSLLNPN